MAAAAHRRDTCTPTALSRRLAATGDERTGLAMLEHALTVPTRQIALNSGADPAVVVARMRTGAVDTGFDAARGEYVDLVAAGIIDATKVVRLALEHAVSVASVLLLTEATLVELPEAHPATPEPRMEA